MLSNISSLNFTLKMFIKTHRYIENIDPHDDAIYTKIYRVQVRFKLYNPN